VLYLGRETKIIPQHVFIDSHWLHDFFRKHYPTSIVDSSSWLFKLSISCRCCSAAAVAEACCASTSSTGKTFHVACAFRIGFHLNDSISTFPASMSASLSLSCCTFNPTCAHHWVLPAVTFGRTILRGWHRIFNEPPNHGRSLIPEGHLRRSMARYPQWRSKMDGGV
jgi:hypothetical protein